MGPDYESKTLIELRDLCKERGIKYVFRDSKAALVAKLEAADRGATTPSKPQPSLRQQVKMRRQDRRVQQLEVQRRKERIAVTLKQLEDAVKVPEVAQELGLTPEKVAVVRRKLANV